MTTHTIISYQHDHHYLKPGIKRVQALAGISRSATCCHGNKSRAPVANLPNTAQLEGTPYHSSKLHSGPCSSLGMRRGTDRHTDRHTQGRAWPIHISSRLRLSGLRWNVARHRASTSTRWHFAFGAMLSWQQKPVHWLQIRPIVHNYHSPSYIQVCAVV